jgi:pimeloyl-ACP methyl ester carboxylesterase
MEIVVGAGMALAVAWIATWIGFDRDRAFYPVVLIVVASYYDLFAAIGGSPSALGVETLLFAGFFALGMIGFRTSLWVVVAALFAHGALDLIHGRVISNPGVPAWWPMFCLAYDWTAATYLGWRMLGRVIRHGTAREAFGQNLRIVAAAAMTPVSLIPGGDTGDSHTDPFQRLPILGDLSSIIASARSRNPVRGPGYILLIGVLLTCMPLARATAEPSIPTRDAQVDGHRVAYQVLGAGGPAIVMISGLGDGMESFQTAAADLAKTATVIVYDRPGYGVSSPSSGPADAEDAARDLAAVLAQSGIRGPYVLVGHSLGGLYAEYYAARHPDQIAGLVLEESRPADFTRRCEAAGIGMCAPTGFLVRMLPKGAQDEVAGLATTLTQVETAGPIHGAPVLVMSRPIAAKASPFEALWKQAQADLAERYDGAVHLTALAGGHYIHRDQRAWFVTAVQQFAKARITP